MTRSPAGGCAVHHVDGGDFALGLQEGATDLREIERGGFGNFAGGSDGITVIGVATGEDCAFDDGDVSFTELPHGNLLELELRPGLAHERQAFAVA